MLIMIVFLTACGKAYDEHSEIEDTDIEDTIVTEQASTEKMR